MKTKSIIIAFFLYFIMSLSSVFMKYASMQEAIMQKGIFYIISILTLGLFAILWQKLLVKNQLNKVYVFKSTTIIWGMIFGYIRRLDSSAWYLIREYFSEFHTQNSSFDM